MNKLTKIKVIVFDFDGVLVDSNQLKYDAWFEIFNESEFAKKNLQKVLEKMREATRFEILSVVSKLLRIESEERAFWVQRYAELYNRAVQSRISSGGLRLGLVDLLQNLILHYNLYISSATPEIPLLETVKELGIFSYFKSVLGSPLSKDERLLKIIQQENCCAKEVLVVGDGEGDRNSAFNNGCQFIGLINDFNEWKKTDQNLILINNFLEFKQFLI